MKKHETMTLDQLREWFEQLKRGEISLADEPRSLPPDAWAHTDLLGALKRLAEANMEIFRAARGQMPNNGFSGPPLFHIMTARRAIAEAEEELVAALNSIEKQKTK